MDDEHSAQDIRFHEETAAEYDRTVTREFAIYHRHVLEPALDRIAAERPGGRALDMGAGTGVVAMGLARRGLRVTAVDHSPSMLALAEAKARALGLDGGMRFERGDVTALAYEDGHFDAVACQGLLHHLDGFDDCLREARRLLAPGGLLWVSEPCVERTPLRRAYDAAVGALLAARRLALRRPRRPEPGTVEAPISGRRLAERLRALGFEAELRYMTHLPYLHFFLGDRPRLAIARLASAPWRRRRGDLVFVLARRPR